MGIPEITNWIDWLSSRDTTIPERDAVVFLRLQYAGRTYLAAPPWLWRSDSPPWWIEDIFYRPDWRRVARRARLTSSRHHPGLDFGWFAIEEKAGVEFLNALSSAIGGGERQVPGSMDLPTFEPTGFGLNGGEPLLRGEAEEAYQYALFRDGLALLGDAFRGQPSGVVVWSPDGGAVLG